MEDSEQQRKLSTMLSPLLGSRGGSLAVDPFRGLLFFEDGGSDAPMDWRETREAHVFDVDLPGYRKEDVKLQLVPEGRVLQISAERKEEGEDEEEGKGHRWHCRERAARGGYSRQFQLPEDAKVGEIKASMRNGVLTVVVPKDREKKINKKRQQKKAVEIGGVDSSDKDSKRLIGRFACCKA